MTDQHSSHGLIQWHGTTIIGVKLGGRTVIAGDGQVSMGNTVMKPNARKVRRIGDGKVIAGFAGATADAFTLFERLERKLEQHRGQLMRAAVELAKDWRTAIGSGGNYALAAARALVDYESDPERIARRAMAVAAEVCVFTNDRVTLEVI